jgi:hypothetical protein
LLQKAAKGDGIGLEIFVAGQQIAKRRICITVVVSLLMKRAGAGPVPLSCISNRLKNSLPVQK